MSGSPVTAFALGYLAGDSPLAYEGALTLTRALRRRQQPTIDVNSILAAMQEMEGHIAKQDAHIAGLQREIEELRAYGRKADQDRNELIDWAAKADAELKRRRAGE